MIRISPLAIRSNERPGPGCWFRIRVGTAVRAGKTDFYFPVSEKGWQEAVYQARQGKMGPLTSMTRIFLSCDKGGFQIGGCGPSGRECMLDSGRDDPREETLAGMRPHRRRSR